MDLDKAKQTFIIEARELLASMEEALLGIEGEVDPGESINAMFRAVHTIKGSAGLFGLDPVVRFAHTVESVMDRVRARQVTLGPPLIGLLLECHDHLENLIASSQEGVEEAPESREVSQKLLNGLVPYLEGNGASVVHVTSAPNVPWQGSVAGPQKASRCCSLRMTSRARAIANEIASPAERQRWPPDKLVSRNASRAGAPASCRRLTTTAAM